MLWETTEEVGLSQIEEGARKLSEFGLTPYEARVYLAAVKLGTASASKISKVASIRREEVYRTLPKLEKSGLVDRILGRPVRVRAIPLEEGLSMLIRRKEDEAKGELARLQAKKQELITNFNSVSVPTEIEKEGSHFTLLVERDAVAARVNTLIETSESGIDVVDSSDNIIRFVMKYSDALRGAANRKVRVRLITECPDDENKIPAALSKHVPNNSFALRYVEQIPSRYIIFDGNEVMITTSAEGTMTENKCLWTDDTSMVSLIYRDYEELYGESLDWKDFQLSSSQKMNRIINRLKPRDHVILVYDSVEAKRRTLFYYVEQGLSRGEAAKYVCAEETPEEVRHFMKAYGIDVSKYEESGALSILDYSDLYIKNGKFSIVDVMNSWEEYYHEALAKGFNGLRVTGEMSCFIDHSLVDELVEYEKALHTILDIPIIAICAYNSNSLANLDNPIDIYSELVKAHGKVLFAGIDNSVGKIEIRAA
ncbi:MAG: hypothetical protein EAX95_01880 [Candidatus Thorarchaeota archaeon]|nr:hypothetical protein [Candidatus Thorarchaeota archaeon]